MRSLIAGAALLALMIPALADDCIAPSHTIADDKANVEAKGIEYLGLHPMPFTDQPSVFYVYHGTTYVSPITSDGCVAPIMYRVGPYLPEHPV